MAFIDLSSPAGKIHTAIKDLQIAWGHATEKWHDENSRYFEEHCLLPLAMTAKLSLDAIGRMSEHIQRAEHACADEWRVE